MTKEELLIDFADVNEHYLNTDDVVLITLDEANRILEEKLLKAPEVFGSTTGTESVPGHKFPWTAKKHRCDTHQARIVCIEEIKK